MEKISFDIMIDDRFLCTLEFPHNPAFPINIEELREFAITKRPSLAKRDFRIEFNKGTIWENQKQHEKNQNVISCH